MRTLTHAHTHACAHSRMRTLTHTRWAGADLELLGELGLHQAVVLLQGLLLLVVLADQGAELQHVPPHRGHALSQLCLLAPLRLQLTCRERQSGRGPQVKGVKKGTSLRVLVRV